MKDECSKAKSYLMKMHEGNEDHMRAHGGSAEGKSEIGADRAPKKMMAMMKRDQAKQR